MKNRTFKRARVALSLLVRLVLDLRRRLRHALVRTQKWLTKRARRTSKSLGAVFAVVARPSLRALKRPARAWSKKQKQLSDRTRRTFHRTKRVVRQIVFYSPPGELRRCPACDVVAVSHIEPLRITRPVSRHWRVGFISGCENCGVLFANPLPGDDELAHLYSPDGAWGLPRQSKRTAVVSRARLAEYFAPIASELNVLAPGRSASVLDIGCGLGSMLDALASAGWLTSGIDPAVRLAFARHRDAVEISGDPQFDLVILHHVLEHVASPLEMLRRAAGALHVGGYLFVSVPNLDRVAEHGDMQYCLRSKTHIMAYSEVCLRWLAATAGLVLVSAKATHKSRHLACIFRRDATPTVLQATPLLAGRESLSRYFKHHPRPDAPARVLPVRLRSALLNFSIGGAIREH